MQGNARAWVKVLAVAVAHAAVAGCAGGGAPLGPGAAGPPGGAAAASAVVARIPLRTFGTGIAIAPDGSRALVATSAELVALDVPARSAAGTIEVGNVPYGVALSPDGGRGYAVDLLQQLVWFLDLRSQTVARKLWLGSPGQAVLRPGIAVSPDGTRVYATVSAPTGQAEDSLRVFDAASGNESRRSFDFHPGQLAATRDGRRLWITGCHGFCSDGIVHVLDAATLAKVGEVALPSVPGGIAVAADGGRGWVANGLAGSVSVVDASSGAVAANVPVGAEPLGVALSPDGTRVWVTCFAAGTLVGIDAATGAVVAQIPVGEAPRAIALTPDGRYAWLTHSTPIVSVVDLSRG
ncbi:MAG TPA: YncE family protein [Candidatus Binatia bacterium]|nr:YncE family protein [Candidatus Binatia bacterium]